MVNRERESGPSSTLADVVPIKESRGRLFTSREELKDYVESPLLNAVETLYDKNIQTAESTANRDDVQYGKVAGLVINYDTLSEENQRIAQTISIGHITDHSDGYKALVFEVPITAETSVDDISSQMEQAATQFVWQPLTWMPTYTIQELRRLYGIDEDDDNYNHTKFDEYYDPATERFYVNEEQYRRANHLPI